MFEKRELWLRHLSASLKANGQVAYLWDVENDRFEFAGDHDGLFGLGESDMPAVRDQMYKLINPQDLVERQLVLGAYIDKCADAPIDFQLSYRLRRSDGHQVDVIETGTVFKDTITNKKTVQSVIARDLTAAQAVRSSQQIENGALAHMPNAARRTLQNQIEEYLEQNRDRPAGFFLTAGVDHFAMINEVYGSETADELLNQTEKRLEKIVGNEGIVTRLHGDLFGIFFKKGSQLEMSESAYAILRGFYSQPFFVTGYSLNNMVSIGGVAFDTPNLRASSILTQSELALREAKNRGRGCFVCYSEGSNGDGNVYKDYLAIGDQFLKAFREGRVRLAYQKIVNSQSGEVSFHECLIRMIDENGKVISAGQFIDAVEKMGMTRLVDNFSTRRAIQELRIFPDLVLSINVSNHSLTDPQWLHDIQNDLRRSPDVAKRLIVEITESFAMTDVSQTIRVIKALKELGCLIALDDFGAGQTSFTQLRDLKLDMVKIDKSFVRNMNDEDNMLFINVLQSLAGGMKIQTVGEGAETMAEAKILADGGINFIQGFAYSIPSMERIWLPEENEFRIPDASKFN